VSSNNLKLPLKFIHRLLMFTASKFNIHGTMITTFYTSCKMYLENTSVTFCATSNYGDDGQWYNWCLVEWVDQNEERNTYQGIILGLLMMQNSVYAVTQSSSDPISIKQLTDEFICSLVLNDDTQIEVVEIETISSTLCVFYQDAAARMELTGITCPPQIPDVIVVGLGLVAFSLGNVCIEFEIKTKLSPCYSFARESWLWCVRRVFSSLAGLDSVYGDTLQNAKQLFFDRIPQMNKYFIMRKCEHIADTSISSQEGVSIFKFPERFLEISCRDLIGLTFQQL
jgi:hypothetical protein